MVMAFTALTAGSVFFAVSLHGKKATERIVTGPGLDASPVVIAALTRAVFRWSIEL